MAKIRKFVSYRGLKRPYTRKSKYREKNYIRANPNILIVRFDMGDQSKQYEYSTNLIARYDYQIRHNAIESARQAANRVLEGSLGTQNFHFIIRKYPHHILRENPLASGAGADRMSTGMAASFGKPIGAAAQVRDGDIVMSVHTDKANIEVAKKALKKASYKFPYKFYIVTESNK